MLLNPNILVVFFKLVGNVVKLQQNEKGPCGDFSLKSKKFTKIAVFVPFALLKDGNRSKNFSKKFFLQKF